MTPTPPDAQAPGSEPDTRDDVIRMLWEKQFKGSPWASKFHLIRTESLEADYGKMADQIIGVVRKGIEDCFILTDRRSPPRPERSETGEAKRQIDQKLERVISGYPYGVAQDDFPGSFKPDPPPKFASPPPTKPSEAGETQLATLIDSIVRDVAQFEYQEDVISITSGQLRDALWTHLTRWVNYDISVPQGLGSALIAANLGLSASPPPTEPTPQDAELIDEAKIIARERLTPIKARQLLDKLAARLSSLSAKGETGRG